MTTPRREQERSRLTRQRLMDACVASLVEVGWTGTTTTSVAKRAGVSRGAQLHHYPTRDELVVAAVEHVGRALTAALAKAAASVPGGPGRTEAVLTAFAEVYTGPVFVAALELWVAARTDDRLRAVVVPLESRFGGDLKPLLADLLDLDVTVPGQREVVDATVDFVHGMGLADLLTDDGPRRARVIKQWSAMLDAARSV